MSLPLAQYFDPRLLDRERDLLLRSPLRYAGHRASVPEPGDYACLPHDNGLVLVNDGGDIALLDNACAHRQALILAGRGRLGRNITCPFHSWTFHLDGSLRRAPGMDGRDDCRGLRQHPTWEWNGLLFHESAEGPSGRERLADLFDDPLSKAFDFEGYRLHAVTVDHYAFDWKIFVEVYLDLYHVRPFHPGLGKLVACDQLGWRFGRDWSCQLAPFGSLTGATPTFESWCELIRQRHPASQPRWGALWLAIYPNTTVEWYADTLVVSTIWPDGPDRSVNIVEFFYPDSLGPDTDRYAKAERAAYEETAVEDGDLCLRMHQGKRSLWRAGRNDTSPDHDPLEAGIAHFHEWLGRNLNPHGH